MKGYLWIVFVLALLGGVVAYRELFSQGVAKRERRSAVTREIPVKVAAVKKGPIAYVLNTSGDVQPMMQVDVISRIAGYVERVNFQIGDRVNAGQVVAIVEPEELRHRVAEEEAAVKVALAGLREKEAQLLHAEKQAQRARLLREKEFISSQELDEAETRANTARAQRDLAQAQLAQRQAMLEQSRYQLALTRVVAPFSGVVTRRLVDPGAYVSTSTPILTIARPDTLKVVVSIPERDVGLVKVGMPARLRLDAFSGRTFEGKVARLNSALDPASRTLTAEIHVSNSSGLIKPGMFARVSMILGERAGALLVPAEAVIEEDGKNFVYSVTEGKARRHAVITGWTQDGYTEVTQGLQENAKIVVAGQYRLKPGMKVRVLGEKEGSEG